MASHRTTILILVAASALLPARTVDAEAPQHGRTAHTFLMAWGNQRCGHPPSGALAAPRHSPPTHCSRGSAGRLGRDLQHGLALAHHARLLARELLDVRGVAPQALGDLLELPLLLDERAHIALEGAQLLAQL